MLAPLLLAVASLTGCTGALEAATKRIETSQHPSIVDLYFLSDWMEGDRLFITLARDSTDRDARDVWCDVIIPAGVPETTSIFVDLKDVKAGWDRPTDCHDPTDMPLLRKWRLQGPGRSEMPFS